MDKKYVIIMLVLGSLVWEVFLFAENKGDF